MCLLAYFFSSLFFLSTNTSVYQTTALHSPNQEIGETSPFQEIDRLEDIAQELEQLSSEDLIVFDVDEVLIASKDGFFHPLAEPFLLNLAKRAVMLAKTEEEKKSVEKKLSLSLVETERLLLEPTSPLLVKKLQKKGIKILALTGFPTGRFGKIPLLEKWRVNHLKSLGIDFSFSFPSLGRHEFLSMAKPGASAPLLQDGILFSRGYSKGDVLLAFLDLIQWQPKKVVLIDDLFVNHQSMDQSLKARGIPFQGFHYLGARFVLPAIDEELIEWQFRHLVENNQWLSDQKAKEMVNAGCKQ